MGTYPASSKLQALPSPSSYLYQLHSLHVLAEYTLSLLECDIILVPSHVSLLLDKCGWKRLTPLSSPSWVPVDWTSECIDSLLRSRW
jgi:hypothetical protein